MDFENLQINYIGFQEYISKGLYLTTPSVNKSKPQNEQELNIISDNNYKAIKNTGVDALTIVNCKIFKKSTSAKMLDVSVDQTNKLVSERPLREECNRIIRRKEVESLTSLSRSGIYYLMDKDQFPKSVKLSEKSVGWLFSDVQEWIKNRVSATRGGGQDVNFKRDMI